MFETRTSENWVDKPGKFDVLNLRDRFPSTNLYGLPDLQPTDFVPTSLAAWNMPRHREYAASTGGALHFYLDDYRFETLWSSPERLLPRVLAVGAALTPDFSVWRDIPRATQIWNTYRSRWVGAFWQSHGVEVIPTVGWGAPDTYDFCFDGIPAGSTVSVSSVGVQNNELAKALFRQGLRELISRTRPGLLLCYGQLRFCDSLDLPDVREYPTYWDRRRKQISEWAEEEDQPALEAAAVVRPELEQRLRTPDWAASPLAASADQPAVVAVEVAARVPVLPARELGA
jgi:hypothetical protein